MAYIRYRECLPSRGDGPLSDRFVFRQLTLIDQVFAHRAHALDVPYNTAAKTALEANEKWRWANTRVNDPLLTFFSASEARALVNFLSEACPREGRPDTSATWLEVRNRTAVALHLRAGLTPGEVRSLKLSSVIRQGRITGLPTKIVAPAHGKMPEHETPIAAWAARLLRHWMEQRALQAPQTEWLFPATRGGHKESEWSKVSHWKAVCAVLEASGIDPGLVEGGAYRLRHTFALRQLRKGTEAALVARWLGITDSVTMARYSRVLDTNPNFVV